jgi:TonB family protein
MVMPEGMSYADAAAIAEAFLTAWDALVARGRVQIGERVLVHSVGSGVGTGQGSGSESGAGSGTGSGYGSGNGNGNGDGDGDGDGRTPPPSVAKVTTPYRIISTPKAMYTDEARTKGIQGSVILKITLLANGSIGSITPVKTLGYGLTEKAIAAARQIRFEPKKVNGVPQSVIITRDYSFSIY